MVKRSKTVPLQTRITPELAGELEARTKAKQAEVEAPTSYGLLSLVVEEALRRGLNLPPLKKEGE